MIRISNVDYINTLPYRKTFEESGFIRKNAVITGQNPAGCVDELKFGMADMGLVPVGALDMLPEFRIVEGFGICAYKKVDSVLVLSDIPLNQLSDVYLDYQSKSSNGFVRILEKNYWKHSFNFLESDNGYENKISGKTGGLIIGDRALKLKDNYRFCTDIAAEWYKFTDMPAVFAVWVANNKVNDDFINQFLNILDLAVINKKRIAEEYANDYLGFDLVDYLNNKIKYRVGDQENQSLKLYQKLLREL